ncbi:MAG TPA: pyrroline-5-carboxylate reductase [Phycisphaerales bacterium]|nr:pyrroline-5-carboxylate reductase [Phycisphaerales bacterium]
MIIGFIGSGNMAEALVRGVLDARLAEPKDVIMSDVRPERLAEMRRRYGVRTEEDNAALAGAVDALVLSVKPQTMGEVLEQIAQAVRPGTTVISIAAGISTARIGRALPNVPVVRVMPNTPALVGAGAAGLYCADPASAAMQTALRIFSAVGVAVAVEREELIDAVTAVSGSGPAYFFLLMEHMTQAAVELGLDAKTAATLVGQTAKGAALLAEQAAAEGQGPPDLRKKVTSPGGTTAAALSVFADAVFEQIVRRALTAARDRSIELSA